ncbi:MAG: hypothetical protein JXB32_21000 [Deltaproteobacteria bacterium]|nr:hypothetical protein [Deltaproteobacteria bacterium]
MLRLRGTRRLACLALALPALAAGGCPSPAPPASPSVAEEPPDAAATADTRPDAPPDDSSGPDDEDARPSSDPPPRADVTTGSDAGRGSTTACRTRGTAALPRCAANPDAAGCPLALPATASVAIEVLELDGYDDLGTRAFEEQVPLLVMCYGEALAAAPEAPVVVETTLDVAPDGCASVRRISGDWPTRRMHDCVRAVLEYRALPPPDAANGARLRLRVEFAS